MERVINRYNYDKKKVQTLIRFNTCIVTGDSFQQELNTIIIYQYLFISRYYNNISLYYIFFLIIVIDVWIILFLYHPKGIPNISLLPMF